MISKEFLFGMASAIAIAHFDLDQGSQVSAFSMAPSLSPIRWTAPSPFPHASLKGPLRLDPSNISNHDQHLTSRQGSMGASTAISSSKQLQQGDSNADTSSPIKDKRHSLRRTIYLHLWVIFTSAFIVMNAKFHPFPQFLLFAITRQQWALVHAISSMLFSGTIILSALIEYMVVFQQKKASVIKFWFLSVPQQLDANIVLPALTGAIVSGVGQASIDYGGLSTSPKHVVGAFHLLLTFGIWWGVTDIISQRKAIEVVQAMTGDDEDGCDERSKTGEDAVEIPKVLKMRVVSNTVSCLFVIGLYALMVLKPGFTDYDFIY